MERIPNESIDMILADLPYGQTARNKWDSVLPFDKLWQSYERIIKPNGAIVLFANGMFTANLMKSNEKLWKYNLVWDKVLVSGFLNANRMQLRTHEDICVFYKRQPTYNPQKVQGAKSHSIGKQAKENETLNYGVHKRVDNREELGEMKHPKSIITFQKPHPSTSVHPTQKPVELLGWLINTYTNGNEVVLDNTAGSCSTAEAAEKAGRRWICIEKEDEYCRVAVNRLQSYVTET